MELLVEDILDEEEETELLEEEDDEVEFEVVLTDDVDELEELLELLEDVVEAGAGVNEVAKVILIVSFQERV